MGSRVVPGMRTALFAAVGLAALVLDPIAGCFGDEPHYLYDDADMRIAVEGTWRLVADGKATTFTIAEAAAPPAPSDPDDDDDEHAERARSWVRPAAACSDRAFVRNAAACMDVATMQLEVRVAGDRGAPSKGLMRVTGEGRFERSEVDLDVGGMDVDAQVSPIGEVVAAHELHGKRVTLARIGR